MTRTRLLPAFALLALLAAAAVPFVPATPPPHVPPSVRAESFEAFYERRLALSAAEGVSPGNAERLVRRTSGRAPVAILYVHGFGASRAEGEAVVDAVAETLGANVYYLRLPGHGGGPDAHAAATATDYLDVVDEAVAHMRLLGDTVVVVGCSTGGLLAAWAAARRPPDVDALVLASPLFGFKSPLAFLAGTPAGMAFIELVEGRDRDASWKSDPDRRKQPGYEAHWLVRQRWRALGALHELVRRCATEATYRAVRVPTLLLYTEKDAVVDVPSMKDAFARFTPHARSRAVAVEDGSHVLLSRFVRTDKPLVTRTLVEFVRDVVRRP